MTLLLAGVAIGAVLPVLCAVVDEGIRFWRERRRQLARLR